MTHDYEKEINTREDYEAAMQRLDRAEFIACMADDFSCWKRETEEVASERYKLRQVAIAKGLIGEHEDENRHWKHDEFWRWN